MNPEERTRIAAGESEELPPPPHTEPPVDDRKTGRVDPPTEAHRPE